MHTFEIHENPQETVLSSELKDGQIAVVADPDVGGHNGKIVFAGFENIVSIQGDEWTKRSKIKVRILPAGTKITITVGE